MLDRDTAARWRGHELIDRDGDRIGTIGEIYLDQETGAPEWATVKTGLFGTKQTFVPIRHATAEGEIVRVPFEKSHVKDAPQVDPEGGDLDEDDERALYGHYGSDYSTERDATETKTEAPGTGGEGEPGELQEDPEGKTVARLRLKRYVVTEEVKVPVRREEIRLEPDED